MALTALAFFAAAVLIGLVAVWRFPETTKRWYERFVAARNVVYAVIVVLMMIVLLQTGSLQLMLVGAFIALILVIALFFDSPLGEVLD